MLLLYQAGAVKVGEVVRYTLTYTPSDDRVVPTPSELHVRIKNTTAIPLRAAFLHGPYQLHCAAYPSTYNPYQKFENPKRDGKPQFEPNLKAGSHWYACLTIPEHVRKTADEQNNVIQDESSPKSVTWIVEVASQILFSATANVHFEVLVGRDERSLDLGFAAVAGKGYGEPGQLKDHLPQQHHGLHRPISHPKGVYSSALKLTVEDTEALWDKPSLPARIRSAARNEKTVVPEQPGEKKTEDNRPRKRQKIHLVMLTHGLHSNVGADMLFMKESIDATVKQAREDRRKRRQERKASKDSNSAGNEEPTATAPLSGGQEDMGDEPDEEQVVVRGFQGNACRTEKGIQYLGKRLAKYILTTTYPDQPFLPASKSSLPRALSWKSSSGSSLGEASHAGSSVHKANVSGQTDDLPYTYTSISFIGHSLGGLIQVYAIAYIQKHSPDFFQRIKPINFISLASPLLGLSNENPMYVKFALDFGLVGRTGQDLGLTWRPPTMARSGWNALLSGVGAGKDTQQPKQDPRAKPLLRVLPTGPAHIVLKMFKNRTLYSNVVNDGVVPLRTSCLLFLDWRGLGKVENARRDNGLLLTMASFGWNELMGANANTISHHPGASREDGGKISDESGDEAGPLGPEDRPSVRAEAMDQALAAASPLSASMLDQSTDIEKSLPADSQWLQEEQQAEDVTSDRPVEPSAFQDFLNFFRPAASKANPGPAKVSRKTEKTYRRAQTVMPSQDKTNVPSGKAQDAANKQSKRPTLASRGSSMIKDVTTGGPPPTTTIFEAAGDIINPPIPTDAWLLDPSSRQRTIFHDRVYHPEDIPPPPAKPRSRLGSAMSLNSSPNSSFTTAKREESFDSLHTVSSEEVGGMRVEEKIARAYHSDLSWRKVLVRLQPDAHNNMIVRRMFANAYGWEVVKHVCDTHFAATYAAETEDAVEEGRERAQPMEKDVGPTGEEVKHQTETSAEHQERTKGKDERDPEQQQQDVPVRRTASESAEARDKVAELEKGREPRTMHSSIPETDANTNSKRPKILKSTDSSTWDDRFFDSDEEPSSDDEGHKNDLPGPLGDLQRYFQSKQADSRGGGSSNRSSSVPVLRPGSSTSIGLHVQTTPTKDGNSSIGSKHSSPSVASHLTKSPVETPGIGLGMDQVYKDLGHTRFGSDERQNMIDSSKSDDNLARKSTGS